MNSSDRVPQPGDKITAQSGISGVSRTVDYWEVGSGGTELLQFEVRDTQGDRWLVVRGQDGWLAVQSLPRE